MFKIVLPVALLVALTLGGGALIFGLFNDLPRRLLWLVDLVGIHTRNFDWAGNFVYGVLYGSLGLIRRFQRSPQSFKRNSLRYYSWFPNCSWHGLMCMPIHGGFLRGVFRNHIWGLNLSIGAREVQGHFVYHVGLQFLRWWRGIQKRNRLLLGYCLYSTRIELSIACLEDLVAKQLGLILPMQVLERQLKLKRGDFVKVNLEVRWLSLTFISK